jgi:hypothetical protein
MAWLGKVAINPNHPFAHSQISFGVKHPSNSSSESEKPKAAEESSSNQPLLEPAADSTGS